ncbi:MAG TPA: hypothetical protein ENG83_13540 [Nitrospirae bacterium]|nr:hypothetical protein [Nitrospirota bacterium]HDZ00550.1 hypothetical protein [Nitrospirota bacterium]
MLRNYFLINVVLIIIIGFLSIKLYKTIEYSVDIPTEATGERVEKKIEVKRKNKDTAESSFDVISKLDLFRPSRSAPQKNKKTAVKASPEKPPRLFGTIILNNEKTAILENPNTKTTKTYRINDSIAGFTVSEILEDRVVLLRDGESIEVRLWDEKKGIASKIKRRPPRRTSKRRSRPVPPRKSPPRTNTREDGNRRMENVPGFPDDLQPGMGY